MISQQRARQVLAYSADTGVFTWLVRRGNRTDLIGKVAGCIDGQGYRTISVDGVYMLAHRLAHVYMTGECPEVVDHANGDRDDNRWVNLLSSTPKLNANNMKKPKSNRSGITGVTYRASQGRWRALIRGKEIGTTKDFFEACCLRKSAEVKDEYFTERHGK